MRCRCARTAATGSSRSIWVDTRSGSRRGARGRRTDNADSAAPFRVPGTFENRHTLASSGFFQKGTAAGAEGVGIQATRQHSSELGHSSQGHRAHGARLLTGGEGRRRHRTPMVENGASLAHPYTRHRRRGTADAVEPGNPWSRDTASQRARKRGNGERACATVSPQTRSPRRMRARGAVGERPASSRRSANASMTAVARA